MVDMFKRPTYPPEYYHIYGVFSAETMKIYDAGIVSEIFSGFNAAA